MADKPTFNEGDQVQVYVNDTWMDGEVIVELPNWLETYWFWVIHVPGYNKATDGEPEFDENGVPNFYYDIAVMSEPADVRLVGE